MCFETVSNTAHQCPRCAAHLEFDPLEGKQIVHVSGTNSSEVAAVSKDLMNQFQTQHAKSPSKISESSVKKVAQAERLTLEKLRLEREYELARMGLGKSSFATIAASVGVLTIVSLGFGASMWGKRQFLSGTDIVMIVAIVAIGLVAFSAMVFGRAARLKAKITEKEKELEMVIGGDVRGGDQNET